MTDRALIDTGPLVAIYSQDDADRERCSRALNQLSPPLLTCWPVLTEAAWLLRKRPDALLRIFRGFEDGLFAMPLLDADDLPAIAAIMRRYEDIGLQLADASLLHLADREGIRTVFPSTAGISRSSASSGIARSGSYRRCNESRPGPVLARQRSYQRQHLHHRYSAKVDSQSLLRKVGCPL